jgi:hypothetical protein
MIRNIFVSSTLAVALAMGAQPVSAGLLDNLFKNKYEITLPSEAVNKVIGVKLEDVVNNYSNLVPGLVNLSNHLKKDPGLFFGDGDVLVVHNVFLNKLPENRDGQITVNLTAYVKYKDVSNFEKLTINYSNRALAPADISVVTDEIINLKTMAFKVQVGLVDRKVIVTDDLNKVKMVFPNGVGGFDEGVLNEGAVSLLTPRFHNGFLDRRAVISKRDKPRYFDGKPFIRILKGPSLVEDMTAIGFHTEINDSFVRGFDSHGCMRLRLSDLMMLHDLIMDGDVQQIPITILYRTKDQADHPAGKRNKLYKTVSNTGTVESPFFPLDKDNLVQLKYKEAEAPMDKLVDLKDDNYEDVFSYDTQLQLKEQNVRRKNECDAKLMAGEIGTKDKDMLACLNAGKRQGSATDGIYRKWMGIGYIGSPDLF